MAGHSGWATELPGLNLLPKLNLWQRLLILAIPLLVLWLVLNLAYVWSGWQALTLSAAICWLGGGLALTILYFCQTPSQIAAGMLFAIVFRFGLPLSVAIYFKFYAAEPVNRERIDWVVAFFMVEVITSIALTRPPGLLNPSSETSESEPDQTAAKPFRPHKTSDGISDG